MVLPSVPRTMVPIIAVASNDGIVRVFLLRIDELLALAETRVTRSLTSAECQKYLHVEACPVADPQ